MYPNTLKALVAGGLRGKASPMNRPLRRGVLLVALGCLLPGLALAAQPKGEWKGLVQQANTSIAADLRFAADAVNVRFSEPLSCSVPARILKDTGAVTTYRFGASTSGGSFCDGLLGRNLTTTQGKDGRLAISFPSAKTTWHGELSH